MPLSTRMPNKAQADRVTNQGLARLLRRLDRLVTSIDDVQSPRTPRPPPTPRTARAHPGASTSGSNWRGSNTSGSARRADMIPSAEPGVFDPLIIADERTTIAYTAASKRVHRTGTDSPRSGEATLAAVRRIDGAEAEARGSAEGLTDGDQKLAVVQARLDVVRVDAQDGAPQNEVSMSELTRRSQFLAEEMFGVKVRYTHRRPQPRGKPRPGIRLMAGDMPVVQSAQEPPTLASLTPRGTNTVAFLEAEGLAAVEPARMEPPPIAPRFDSLPPPRPQSARPAAGFIPPPPTASSRPNSARRVPAPHSARAVLVQGGLSGGPQDRPVGLDVGEIERSLKRSWRPKSASAKRPALLALSRAKQSLPSASDRLVWTQSTSLAREQPEVHGKSSTVSSPASIPCARLGPDGDLVRGATTNSCRTPEKTIDMKDVGMGGLGAENVDLKRFTSIRTGPILACSTAHDTLKLNASHVQMYKRQRNNELETCLSHRAKLTSGQTTQNVATTSSRRSPPHLRGKRIRSPSSVVYVIQSAHANADLPRSAIKSNIAADMKQCAPITATQIMRQHQVQKDQPQSLDAIADVQADAKIKLQERLAFLDRERTRAKQRPPPSDDSGLLADSQDIPVMMPAHRDVRTPGGWHLDFPTPSPQGHPSPVVGGLLDAQEPHAEISPVSGGPGPGKGEEGAWEDNPSVNVR